MPYSKNALTQESYLIPEKLDDSNAIKDFVRKHHGKKVIVVQGLGFVGAVMSLVCSNALTEEYAVIGVDLPNEDNHWKIKSINEGIFPLIADDPKISEFYESSRIKGNFYATYDTSAYSYADVIIVDINLDVQKESEKDGSLKSYNVNLDGFKKAINKTK